MFGGRVQTRSQTRAKAAKAKSQTKKQQSSPIQTTGTERQVWNGTALHTPGGNTKKDLVRVRNKDGSYRIVSRKRRAHGKRMFKKNKLSQFSTPEIRNIKKGQKHPVSLGLSVKKPKKRSNKKRSARKARK